MTKPRPLAMALASAVGVALILAYWPLRMWGEGWLNLMADDAFFYFVIAKNLATQGLSSFDGTTLTNGYQPLWQAVLALQYALLGEAWSATALVESLMVAFALFLAFRAIDEAQSWCLPLFAATAAALICYPLVLDGMETSITFLAFSAFVLALRASARADSGSVALAITGGAVIAGRLDAACFVVPALLIVPQRTSRGVQALFAIAVCGVLYCAANKLVFDAWIPVSGSIKSLGAFARLNSALVDQLRELWPSDQSLANAALSFLRGWIGRCLGLFVVTAVLLVLQPRRESFGWRLGFALEVGFVIFATRLLFFTSWRAWEWYAFPTFFLLVADFILLVSIVKRRADWRAPVVAAAIAVMFLSSSLLTFREALMAGGGLAVAWLVIARGGRVATVARAATVALGVMLLALTGLAVMKAPPQGNPVVGRFSLPLAEKVRAAVGVEPVAMADRAAAFAYFYGGPVTQLEGLVNDMEYYRTVADRRPVLPLLCRRGVRYLLSFEVDLGDYATRAVDLFRPALTMFDGPKITVSRGDEEMKIADGPGYGVKDKDPIVYLWRLPCPAS